MHRSQRERVVATAAVAVAAVAAVAVALLVVSLTRPSDRELQEEVALRLGVPEPVLDLPIVQQVLEQTSDEARSVVLEQLDQSLLLGAIAGLLAAVAASALIMRPWRAPAEEAPEEPGVAELGDGGDVDRGG